MEKSKTHSISAITLFVILFLFNKVIESFLFSSPEGTVIVTTNRAEIETFFAFGMIRLISIIPIAIPYFILEILQQTNHLIVFIFGGLLSGGYGYLISKTISKLCHYQDSTITNLVLSLLTTIALLPVISMMLAATTSGPALLGPGMIFVFSLPFAFVVTLFIFLLVRKIRRS